MQTLSLLHHTTMTAHMDTSSAYIMLSLKSTQPWDTVRLIDFGFATPSSSGKSQLL